MEVLADAVTEENLAKVEFDTLPEPLPPIGELAEVSVDLPELEASPAIPNAAIQNVDGKLGIWKIEGGKIRFTVVKLGAADLEGVVQVKSGLKVGDRIVVHSASRLASTNRIRLAENPAELLK